MQEPDKLMAWGRAGDGSLRVRVRPSSLKRDCGRRATGTGGKGASQRTRDVTLDPGMSLRPLRPETKGQAGACPDRTRAIPCKVRAGTEISVLPVAR